MEKEQLEETQVEFEEQPELEKEHLEVEKETIDQVEDFTLETTSVRSSLMRRVPITLGASLLFFIIRVFDKNYIFNPVNATIFEVLAVFTLFFCVLSGYMLLRVEAPLFSLKSTYEKMKKVNDILDFLSVIPVLMLIITITNIFFVSFSPISGTSMEPNFHDDQAVVFSHIGSSYDRFDVIIVYVEELNDPYLIKRVIGLPGETVLIDDNEIYINDVLLPQTFIDQDVVETVCITGHFLDHCSFDVPEDSYFVLGDNRDGHGVIGEVSGYSIDSRTFGPVPVEDIYGKVILTFRDFNLLD